MADNTFPEVVSIDVVADKSGPNRTISSARISDLRDLPRVQRNADVQSSRHLIVVPDPNVLGRHMVEGEEYSIEPGSVLHVEPGQLHRLLHNETFDGWAIAIDEHIAPPGLFDLPAPSPLAMLGTSIEVAHVLVTALTAPEMLPKAAQQRLQLSMAAVLLELIAGASGRTIMRAETAAEHRIVGDFRRELEFHYLSTRSVGDYANLVGCSAKTLTRATKAVVGQTPKEIIDRRVAYAACRLLANTDISVNWIAYKLGFSEQSNFSKFFHRKVEMTPAAYRAACVAGQSEII